MKAANLAGTAQSAALATTDLGVPVGATDASGAVLEDARVCASGFVAGLVALCESSIDSPSLSSISASSKTGGAELQSTDGGAWVEAAAAGGVSSGCGGKQMKYALETTAVLAFRLVYSLVVHLRGGVSLSGKEGSVMPDVKAGIVPWLHTQHGSPSSCHEKSGTQAGA